MKQVQFPWILGGILTCLPHFRGFYTVGEDGLSLFFGEGPKPQICPSPRRRRRGGLRRECQFHTGRLQASKVP